MDNYMAKLAASIAPLVSRSSIVAGKSTWKLKRNRFREMIDNFRLTMLNTILDCLRRR